MVSWSWVTSAFVEVFRLRTKKSGGRVELGSRDLTLCCHPDWTKTSTETLTLHFIHHPCMLILGTKIYQFSMISIWKSCVDVYCLLLKECGESSECQLDILPAVGRCWAVRLGTGRWRCRHRPRHPGYHAISPGYKSDQQRRDWIHNSRPTRGRNWL